MTIYKIVVAYDGTDYRGWQRQKKGRTIIQGLKDSFFSAFCKKKTIVGASRTDAGVHAFGQVAKLSTNLPIDPETLASVWNNALPFDVVIRSVSGADQFFHPQKNVKQKVYHYDFFVHRVLPFEQRYGYHCRRSLCLSKLKAGLEVFVGTHDFRSFYTGADLGERTIRTIDSIDLKCLEEDKKYRIVVKGKSFLRYMIRRIVGGAFEIAIREDLDAHHLQKALEERNPVQNLPTAPAKGLCLYSINYEGENND